MPEASQLTDFNRFILAFWMSERGAVDNAQMWEWMSASDRQEVSHRLVEWVKAND
jgi:chitinase